MGNIIGRTVFSAPIYGTAEMVAASIVIIVFLQAGYAIRSRSMLRADFLVVLLPDKVQRVLLAVGYLLGAAFFLMIITGGWEESIKSFSCRANTKAKAPCACRHGRRAGR